MSGIEKLIYFDHAATSYPKPESVIRAMNSAIRDKGGNPGRSGHILSYRAAKAIFECREKICELVSFSSPERIIFAQNTTHALNMAIRGLAGRDNHIVISNLEHNSVLRPVHALSQSGEGITYSVFDALDEDDDTVLFNFKSALRQNTRLAVITYASNVCGKILPVERIASVCKAKGIKLIVDAAQAGGVIPINFDTVGADVICFAGHKGLYGPQGTGVMICAESVEPECFIFGGNGVNSSDLGMGGILPERLEAGTLNTPGICGLCEGVKYVIKTTPEEIFGRSLLLCEYASQRLLDIENIRIHGNFGVRVPVILFEKAGMSPEKLSEHLSDAGICTRSGLHCAPLAHTALGTQDRGGVRISLSHLNTKNEIDRFLLALKRV